MEFQEILSEYQEQKKIASNEGRRGVENLCKLVHAMGYKDTQYFGQFASDGCYGDLIEFLEDNSGCIGAIKEWIAEHDCEEWRDNVESHLTEKDCLSCGEPITSEDETDEEGVRHKDCDS